MRFSEALPKAISLIESEPSLFQGEFTLVRDLCGRIRIAVPSGPDKTRNSFAKNFHVELGAFSPGERHVFLFEKDMFVPDAIFQSPDRIAIRVTANLTIFLLDRQITGHDWVRAPLVGPPVATPPKRVTFFGLKGGVGRSTALVVLAWRLARLGKQVLVIDLDLESPGIGSLLLPRERLPDFGVVDWFVEAAVGQTDDGFAAEMAADSPLISSADLGRILVVPAAGQGEKDYLAKLSRAYFEVKTAGAPLLFGERLFNMLQGLERQFTPDVVLLDSRAGMHDIAAVTVTRLDALAFLFAVDGAYTWEAYRLLFQHWGSDRNLVQRFRENLRMVAGLVPDTGRSDYFKSFRQEAYQLFTEYVYDPAGSDESATEGESPFSFDLMSDSAPHDFLHVNWNRAFFSFDPVRHPEAVDDGLLQGGFGTFVERAAEIILGSPVKWS